MLSKVVKPYIGSILSKMGEDEIEDALSAYKRRIASSGGKGRARKLSAARRKEIATKASKAAAKARTAKKKGKKQPGGG